MPGRDEGKMLRSTHPQFIPGTNQLLICTNDIENNSERRFNDLYGQWIC